MPSLHWCMGHTAWAPDGREGRSQAGPKGRQLEVGARRAPRLLVIYKIILNHLGWGENYYYAKNDNDDKKDLNWVTWLLKCYRIISTGSLNYTESSWLKSKIM